MLYSRWVAQNLPSFYYISCSVSPLLAFGETTVAGGVGEGTSLLSKDELLFYSSDEPLMFMFSSSCLWSSSTRSGASMLIGSGIGSGSKTGLGHFCRKVMWAAMISSFWNKISCLSSFFISPARDFLELKISFSTELSKMLVKISSE